MRCLYCNREIPDDSVFCPECGASQQVPEPQVRQCPACGAILNDGAAFCEECGTPVGNTPIRENAGYDAQDYRANDHRSDDWGTGGLSYSADLEFEDEQEGKSGKNKIIIGVAVAVLVIVLAIVIFLFVLPDKKDDKKSDKKTEQTEEDGVDLSKVDFNLMESSDLELSGLVKKNASGDFVLHWNDGLSFYGKDKSSDDKVLLEDIQDAYIQGAGLPDGMLADLKANQTVNIKGGLQIEGDKVKITPTSITDNDGNDLVAAFENKGKQAQQQQQQAPTQQMPANGGGYVLPQSSSVVLTNSDISGMSIQQINYAKNEIYARHGRLFASPELQNYFNSQSWYHGTISPANFSDSMLSDVEKKNVGFLANVEFGMNPNGYQLDAH